MTVSDKQDKSKAKTWILNSISIIFSNTITHTQTVLPGFESRKLGDFIMSFETVWNFLQNFFENRFVSCNICYEKCEIYRFLS